MESIQLWGIDFITAIQQIQGPFADAGFRAITFLGDEEFFLLLLPFIFWCLDFGLGARLTLIFLLSSLLNFGLKDIFQQPRPFELAPDLMISSTSGYGFPSNHAQAAVVVWGSIASGAGRKWIWAAAILLIILVGFSRVYLGVHFPTDVLAGWLVGSTLLVVFLRLEPGITKRLTRFNLPVQLGMVLVLPVIFLLIHPVKDAASAMGAMAGAGSGLVLNYRYMSFSTNVTWLKRVIRFAIGGAIVFGLYTGLKQAFPAEESLFFPAFRFLRYSLIGIWVSLGAPWLFIKMKI